MKTPKEQISASALMFSVACYFQGSSLLLGYVVGVTKQDTWIVIIPSFFVNLLILSVYISLANKFPGKNLIEINDIVLGNILGKIFSVMYLFYFFSFSFLDSRVMGDFVSSSVLPETPMAVILVMFVFACCYAVRKGAANMTKCSMLFSIFTIAVLLINEVLLIPNINLNNFFPMFSLPIKNYIQGTHTLATIPPSGTFLFFMLFPSLKNPRNIKNPLLAGTIIGTATMLLIVTRDTAVFGSAISLNSNTTFEVVRLINIADILTRMEIVYAMILLMLLFFTVCIDIYAAAKAAEQLFHISSYKTIVFVIGALTVSFTLSAFKSSAEYSFLGENIAAIYSTFFAVILPLITLIVASLRGFHKAKAVSL